jgi:hypothetical protein
LRCLDKVGLSLNFRPIAGPQQTTFGASNRLMHCNMIGTNRKAAFAAALQNSVCAFVCSGNRLHLPLPTPTKQTQCAEAGGKQR